MTISFAPIHIDAPDDATREAWLESLADLRSEADDTEHHIDELNGTLAYGGIPSLGLDPVACAVGIIVTQFPNRP
jgi:hypothetical protein